MNTTTCDDCGQRYGIGDSPYCRDGHLAVQPQNAGKSEYYDDHVAPPPSREFIPPKGIDYHPDKGYRITNPGDINALQRRAGTKDKGPTSEQKHRHKHRRDLKPSA